MRLLPGIVTLGSCDDFSLFGLVQWAEKAANNPLPQMKPRDILGAVRHLARGFAPEPQVRPATGILRDSW